MGVARRVGANRNPLWLWGWHLRRLHGPPGRQSGRACVTPLSAAERKEVRTIEGLAEGDTLHPVQQTFIDEQVPQCGWCMSGQIMAAAALLDQNPQPSEDEIVETMSANYCRCGCYTRILRAVARAAEGGAL